MTRPLRVQICNERFLLRFGVDRILTILGEHLAQAGMEVSFACLRADRVALARVADSVDVIELPDGLSLADADEHASACLIAGWRESRPDVLVVGGWPFFGLAARAGSMGVDSIFIDAGAVPHDGLPASALPTQTELRRLRQRTLPAIGTVLPISDFIRRSQTEPDRGRQEGVETVLLGADHLQQRRFDAAPVSADEQAVLDDLDARIAEGARPILLSGRFEAEGYKNSPAIFDLLIQIRIDVPTTCLVVLGGTEQVLVPLDLEDAVIVLGPIGDEALVRVMDRMSLGMSMSLWEGFNLPIAEMQQLGKPVLAFDVGAHPEVIADPWLLCVDEAEMRDKAVMLLQDGCPAAIRALDPFAAFRDRFGWNDVLARWTRAIVRLARPSVPAAATPPPGRRLVLADVSNSCRDPANSGVVRVTRRLTAELASRSDLDVVFLAWNGERETYRLVDPRTGYLASNFGPLDWLGTVAHAWSNGDATDAILRASDPVLGRRPVLFLPEIALDGSAPDRVAWGKRHQLATASILYDLLPIYQAQYVSPAISAVFPAYLEAVAATDKILAISSFTAAEFHRYRREAGMDAKVEAEAVWLPGQFGESDRRAKKPSGRRTAEPVEVLCVSTIEPRKNHRALVKAFQDLRRRRPDLPIRLHLVGNSYSGSGDLSSWLKETMDGDETIVWHRILSDEDLAALYDRASFTVYPSLAEGFGLPIMESLWTGCPAICHEDGVMAELAQEGGCLMVDASNDRELSAAIEELAGNDLLLSTLREQAGRRAFVTWNDYAGTVGRILRELA